MEEVREKLNSLPFGTKFTCDGHEYMVIPPQHEYVDPDKVTLLDITEWKYDTVLHVACLVHYHGKEIVL